MHKLAIKICYYCGNMKQLLAFFILLGKSQKKNLYNAHVLVEALATTARPTDAEKCDVLMELEFIDQLTK